MPRLHVPSWITDLPEHTILPIQFSPPRPTTTPERKLLAAILELALDDAKHDIGNTDSFFHSTDIKYPFSFINICHHLSLDPQAVIAVINSPRRKSFRRYLKRGARTRISRSAQSKGVAL